MGRLQTSLRHHPGVAGARDSYRTKGVGQRIGRFKIVTLCVCVCVWEGGGTLHRITSPIHSVVQQLAKKSQR